MQLDMRSDWVYFSSHYKIEVLFIGRVFAFNMLYSIFVLTCSVLSFGTNRFFFLENPEFSANIAKFDFINTVIIMRKIGSDLPSPNISFIRPIFNYL